METSDHIIRVWHRLPFRRRLLLAALLAAGPLILLSVVLLTDRYFARRQIILQRNLTVAELSADTVAGWLEGNVRALRAIGTSLDRQYPTLREIPRSVLRAQLAQQPAWDSITVVGADGYSVATTIETPPFYVGDRAYFLEAKRTGQAAVSDLLIGRATGRPIVIVASPIVHDGQFQGIVATIATTDDLARVMERVPVEAYTVISLVGGDRRVIRQFDTRAQYPGDPFAFRDTPQIFSGSSGTVITRDPRTGQRVLMGYAPVAAFGWTVAITTPFTVIMAPLVRSMLLVLLVVALVVAASLVWSFRSATAIARQVTHLVNGARAIGHGHFDTRVSLRGVAEFEALATSLNSMAQELGELHGELEQRVMERTVQLETANKELEAFSYSVSHDLRAPLRAVDGFSQALLEDYSDKLDDEGKEHLAFIRQGAQQMAGLIDDLLRLSRVGRAEMRWELVNLSELARAVADELQQRDPARQVEWIIAPAIRVMGDQALLRIVLDNLLGNAWKFTSKRPQARIEFAVTEREGETVYFVRDNGAGFDMAYAEKLFVPFQRLHTPEEFPGTGIGLAIVQRIIHRHGGRVWAEGVVDQGATVYFTLSRYSHESLDIDGPRNDQHSKGHNDES